MLVALGARGPDGGAAGGVEQAELDADGVGDFAHDAAEGVDFADQMAFGDAADGGIAGHLRDQVDIERVEGGLQAHAGGGHGGFASGVAGADDHHVELFGERHCETASDSRYSFYQEAEKALENVCAVTDHRRSSGLETYQGGTCPRLLYS